MTDEQSRVLDMLSEGKVNAEEAERLLAALSANLGGDTASGSDPVSPGGQRERVSVVLEAEHGAGTGESRDDTFDVAGPPRVVVNNTNGRVECAVGPDGSVRVQAKLRKASSVDYRVNQDGDKITVDVRGGGKASLLGFLGRSGGADIIVTAPQKTDLELQTKNGAVEANGFEGSASMRATNGGITLSGIKGDFEVETVNGRTTVRECEGAGRLRSVNGQINLEQLRGSVSAESVNGQISYEGEMAAGGKNHLENVNGSIKVKLLGTPSLKIDASCARGPISSYLPGLSVSGMVGRQLAGTLGDGEAELAIRTVNGSVTIE